MLSLFYSLTSSSTSLHSLKLIDYYNCRKLPRYGSCHFGFSTLLRLAGFLFIIIPSFLWIIIIITTMINLTHQNHYDMWNLLSFYTNWDRPFKLIDHRSMIATEHVLALYLARCCYGFVVNALLCNQRPFDRIVAGVIHRVLYIYGVIR